MLLGVGPALRLGEAEGGPCGGHWGEVVAAGQVVFERAGKPGPAGISGLPRTAFGV